ncbi:unnamed protein product [Meganyctiphanes norvegica]|uniref:Dehydrogenase/reductase SDR family member 11 n=1 Tax=Meganyctiphanes norvegica TaxID=48144 RepID=A0AAV2S1Y7_MEGNR
MNRWTGRVALVTGASVGIGAAVCRALVAHGMKVVGAARNVDKIQALADELKDHPGSLMAVRCDVSKDADIMDMFADIKRMHGGVDACINNAGISYSQNLLEGTPDQWREMMNVNVVGLCLCTREAVASMRARGVDDGQIIHVNTMSGHRVIPSNASYFYAASKFAVTAVTEGLRQELRELKTNIRVAGISPGVVETDFHIHLKGDVEARKLYESMECIQPKDMADSIVHILSAPKHVQIHDILLRPTQQPL